MSDQWFIIGYCKHCNAPCYELCYPTTTGWAPTGDRQWKDHGFDCSHELKENFSHEVYSCPNN